MNLKHIEAELKKAKELLSIFTKPYINEFGMKFLNEMSYQLYKNVHPVFACTNNAVYSFLPCPTYLGKKTLVFDQYNKVIQRDYPSIEEVFPDFFDDDHEIYIDLHLIKRIMLKIMNCEYMLISCELITVKFCHVFRQITFYYANGEQIGQAFKIRPGSKLNEDFEFRVNFYQLKNIIDYLENYNKDVYSEFLEDENKLIESGYRDLIVLKARTNGNPVTSAIHIQNAAFMYGRVEYLSKWKSNVNINAQCVIMPYVYEVELEKVGG